MYQPAPENESKAALGLAKSLDLWRRPRVVETSGPLPLYRLSAPIGARSDVVVSRGLLLRVLRYSLCRQSPREGEAAGPSHSRTWRPSYATGTEFGDVKRFTFPYPGLSY